MTTDKQISQYRSYVIEKFINLEMMINVIITIYYLKKTSFQFLYEVLYDEYFSFALKRRILVKILDNINKLDEKEINKLNRMNTIRNYYAHCRMRYTPIEGEEYYPDPRKKGKKIDFEKMYKEFIKNEKTVLDYLFKIYEEMGGQFLENILK